MSSNLAPELDTLPVGSVFEIKFDPASERFSDEIFGYFIDGRITFGDNSIEFETTVTQGWMDHHYEDQWKEAARRIVSGHDRTAFLTHVCAGGWGMNVMRWLMWRKGEKLYSTLESVSKNLFNDSRPYDDIKSLETKAADRRERIHVISLHAIKDYLSSHGTNAARLEELERPCEQCGLKMQRCNLCTQCLNCRGGVGDAELGYCAECTTGGPK